MAKLLQYEHVTSPTHFLARRAVYVDRDGTLNEMVYDETHGTLDSPFRVEDVRLRPGAAEFLRGVRAMGYLTVLVTNQPGIAKGALTQARLDEIHNRLQELLAETGAILDDIRYCPHHPQGRPGTLSPFVRACHCRKPAPAMLIAAAKDLAIDLQMSWMVGDGLNDIQAGHAAGCKTILVTRLKVEHLENIISNEDMCPDYIVPNLSEAQRIIKENGGTAVA